MLFQGGALFDSLTVWQNVAFRLRHAREPLPRRDARALAIDKLARVGLGPETADLYPAELSGGMQKRVGLARAIATDPGGDLLRRADRRPRPDPGRGHQRADPRARHRDGRHRRSPSPTT